MPFPRTDNELTAAGYEYDNSSKCNACGADIAWYRTPRGKTIPLNEGTLEPHWSTCPKAEKFRKAPSSHPVRQRARNRGW